MSEIFVYLRVLAKRDTCSPFGSKHYIFSSTVHAFRVISVWIILRRWFCKIRKWQQCINPTAHNNRVNPFCIFRELGNYSMTASARRSWLFFTPKVLHNSFSHTPISQQIYIYIVGQFCIWYNLLLLCICSGSLFLEPVCTKLHVQKHSIWPIDTVYWQLFFKCILLSFFLRTLIADRFKFVVW